jgi:hypothetical protein
MPRSGDDTQLLSSGTGATSTVPIEFDPKAVITPPKTAEAGKTRAVSKKS